jgi:RND family efflux transporter MFP subunit
MDHSPPTASFATRTAKRTGIALGALALGIVVWSAFAAHLANARLKEQAEEQAIVTVATVKPQPQAATAELALPGSVQAYYDAPIYARTNGYLKRWLVDIGAHVKAGQLLAEIDAPELDQQLRQAQADVANAEAASSIASLTAERWRGLRETDSVSKQEADEKVSLAAAASAQLEAARANLQRLRELTAFKRIVAPFDGVVTARNTDVGQLISAGSGAGPDLFRIADTRRLRLYVRVPQSYAALMQPDLAAQVRFPDRPGQSYPARLERTSSALDATSRTLLAQLLVDNPKGELLPGAYAEVHFNLPATAGSSLRLPANVLLAGGDGVRVATVGPEGRVVMKPVTIGRDYGQDIEIVSGLAPDDDVIVNPPDSLAPDTVVRIARPAAPAAANP